MKSAEVSFDDKTVTIVMKAGKTLKEEDLKKAFEGTRFSVTSFNKVEKDEKKAD